MKVDRSPKLRAERVIGPFKLSSNSNTRLFPVLLGLYYTSVTVREGLEFAKFREFFIIVLNNVDGML
jgi:hypothetical protein